MNARQLTRMSLIPILGGLAACGTPVTRYLPSPLMETSEVRAPLFSASLGGGTFSKAYLSRNASTVRINSEANSFGQNYSSSDDLGVSSLFGMSSLYYLSLRARLALAERFEIHYNVSRLGVKTRIAGPPREKAKAKDVSVALLGGVSLLGSPKAGSSSTYSYSLSTSMYDAGALLGVRLSDGFLLYGGGHLYFGEISGTHKLSTDAAAVTITSSTLKLTRAVMGGSYAVSALTDFRLELTVDFLSGYLASDTHVNAGVAVDLGF